MPQKLIDIINTDNIGVTTIGELLKLCESEDVGRSVISYIYALSCSAYGANDGRYKAHAPISILYLAQNGIKSDVCMLDETNILKGEGPRLSIPTRTHSHDYFELTFILDGEIDILIEDDVHSYKKGDACLINSRVRHREIWRGSFAVVFIAISAEYLMDYTQKYPLVSRRSRIHRFFADSLDENDTARAYLDFRYSQSAKDDGAAYGCVLALLDEFIEHKAGMHYAIMAHTTRLFDALQQNEYTTEFVKLDNSKELLLVEKATKYIEEKKGRVTRSELAEALHYNGDYIDQIFRKYNGTSIHDFSVKACLGEAEKLLRTSELSIGEIIRKLGYENRTSFYNQFKKRYGVTPAEYREKAQNSK